MCGEFGLAPLTASHVVIVLLLIIIAAICGGLELVAALGSLMLMAGGAYLVFGRGGCSDGATERLLKRPHIDEVVIVAAPPVDEPREYDCGAAPRSAGAGASQPCGGATSGASSGVSCSTEVVKNVVGNFAGGADGCTECGEGRCRGDCGRAFNYARDHPRKWSPIARGASAFTVAMDAADENRAVQYLGAVSGDDIPEGATGEPVKSYLGGDEQLAYYNVRRNDPNRSIFAMMKYRRNFLTGGENAKGIDQAYNGMRNTGLREEFEQAEKTPWWGRNEY